MDKIDEMSEQLISELVEFDDHRIEKSIDRAKENNNVLDNMMQQEEVSDSEEDEKDLGDAIPEVIGKGLKNCFTKVLILNSYQYS